MSVCTWLVSTTSAPPTHAWYVCVWWQFVSRGPRLAFVGATNVRSRAWPWWRWRRHLVVRASRSPRRAREAFPNAPVAAASDHASAKYASTEHRSVC